MTTNCRARWLGAASVAIALSLLPTAAAFAQGPQRSSPERNASGMVPPGTMPVEQRAEQFSPRDAEQRGGGNRMSPEERRQLRRDVHQAGRDLYPDRMPPGRREPRR